MKRYLFLLFFILFALTLIGCKPKLYEIKFLGMKDEVLHVQILNKGDRIIYPDDPIAIEGFFFIGWDKDIFIAQKNEIIKAVYEKYKYTVTFYDHQNNIIEEQIVEYGEDAIAPEPPKVEDKIFVKWSKDFSNVTDDLSVKAYYEREYFNVQFLNSYGEVIDTQKVRNGESAIAPNAPEMAYFKFKSWDKDFTNVKKDLTISPQYERDGDFQMTDANYWIQLLSLKYNINNEIMSPEEITQYNESVLSDYSKTKVVDMTKLSQTITDLYLKSLINSYSNINKYKVYSNETKLQLSSTEKNAILENRNLNNISSNIDVQFGLITDFAWMRTYPTKAFSSSYDRDYFQETSLNVGEGVAIYHTSKDGEWYFVQAQNYYGWVQKEFIAICSFDTMVSFMKNENKLLVISDYVIIENSYVRMGQSFPLIEENKDTYKIEFPVRQDDGNLLLKEIILNKTEDYSVGYLQYTYENVFKQAFKLLGINYSWGDKEKDGRDCTSTQCAVYNCFGFMMPRNTTQQRNIPNYSNSVSGTTSYYLKANYKPGTLIYSSGHVMMYIGENENGISYLLHNTSAGDGKCILQSLDDYGGSKIIAILKMQK